MNTDSVDCTRQAYPSPPDWEPAMGDFCWGPENDAGVRYIYICIPGSSARGYDALRCRYGADRGIAREWAWDGNEDKPTLTPSILNEDEWHGHLVAGRLVSC